jgi:hypothetical protein
MNANELADLLDFDAKTLNWKAFADAATMLRQQQAEIKALKKSCLDEIFKRTYANQTAKVMEKYWQEAQAEIDTYKSQKNNQIDTYRYKNLTDEEILQFRDEVPYSYSKDLIDFARAILRKAQEK